MCTHVHVRNCMCMRIQSDSYISRLRTATLIVDSINTLYNMLLHVLIFQSNDDSAINQGRIIRTGTVHAYDYNESVLSLFIVLVKR